MSALSPNGPPNQLDLFGAPLGSPAPEPPPSPDVDPALLADRATRRLAQTEFGRPLLVEAGAGTGKTTTLTARIVSWCLGSGWERAALAGAESEAELASATLGGIVAITFTEAAAAEMARKVGDTLRQLAAGTAPAWLEPTGLAPEAQVRRAGALLGTLDHLVVRTIHAFCRGLLAAHPLEAGIHPELQVDADGSALEGVAREVVEAAIARGYGDPGDPDLLALAGRGHGPNALVDALILLAQAALPPAVLADDPLAPERLRAPVAALAVALEHFATAVSGHLDGAVKKSPTTGLALQALAASLELVPANGEIAAEALCRGLREIWSDNALERLEKWGKGELNKTEEAAAGDRASVITAAAVGLAGRIEPWFELDAALYSAARRALAPLYTELRRELAVRGVATFEDLLVGARSLLLEQPAVARRVRGRITQLLVDEFQDTDAVQCDLVAALALTGPADERPGLFVVGDPKQSIYGWRNADLRAYDAFRQRLTAAGGQVLPLLENFRSVPAILDEVAAVMVPTMVEEPGLQPAFAPLLACERLRRQPGFRQAGRGPVEYWVTAVPSAPGESASAKHGDAVRLEAEAIAQDAARLHREGVAWREMALLLRGFGELDEYLEAFRRAGVPFSVAGDRQYFRRREVIDAAALLRAVVDPGDQLALLAVLRAPFVGVPDAALLPLWRQRFPEVMTELTAPEPAALEKVHAAIAAAAAEVRNLETAIPELVPLRGWELVLTETATTLAELRRDFTVAPADRFLDRLRASVPLEATAAARYLGRYRLANLNRFFRRVGEALENAEGDAGALLRALRRGVGQAVEEEEGRPLAEDDAVQVMTVHRAKGLDFGHVYLGQLHKQDPPDNPPQVVVGRVAGRIEFRLFGQPSPGFGDVAAERRRVETRERVRLLYVAMTRAKERLVLAGAWDRAAAAEVEQARATLPLLARRFPFPPDWLALVTLAEQGGGRVDGDGLQWFFPHLDPAPAATGAASDEAPVSPARPPATGRPSREEARRHAARPLGEAVSVEAHRRLDELLEARPEERGAVSRDVGMAIGTLVHRVFEELDPTAPRPFDNGRQGLDAQLTGLALDEPSRRRAKAGALDLLERAERGGFVTRLAGLEILARELPLVAPAPESDTSALVFRTGSIDLLARDPATGELVVIDYKTDAAGAGELEARAAAYASQLRAYAQAVAENFRGTPVRAELWFLAAGVVLPISAGAE
ncbi:MAG: UvrD-helicase domain-containing protein [Thermoanaerobaculia bacterium]|nr:UvrD-helicase domain-containing protein [Thermoanaerobaculia bacterium]